MVQEHCGKEAVIDIYDRDGWREGSCRYAAMQCRQREVQVLDYKTNLANKKHNKSNNMST